MAGLTARHGRFDRFRAAALAAVVAVVIAVMVAVCLWNARAPTDPLERTLAKLAALDYGLQQKVCAHRSNNIPKYRSANKLFHCIEFDVVLDPPTGGPAAVYHPPAENNHGLTLDFLLANEDLPRGRVWLDVKDLSEDNWKPFLDQLMRLIPMGRRGDTIIETGWSAASVRHAAATFRESGFLFSYYLPTEEAIQCGAVSSRMCDDLRTEVLLTASMGFSHLSFDARAQVFVQSIRDRLPPSMRLLTWDISGKWPQMDLIREVDVYIVRFPSPFSS
jgi:hypothetical protein